MAESTVSWFGVRDVMIDDYLSVCNRRSGKAPRLSLLWRIGKRGRRCRGVVDVVVARR